MLTLMTLFVGAMKTILILVFSSVFLLSIYSLLDLINFPNSTNSDYDACDFWILKLFLLPPPPPPPPPSHTHTPRMVATYISISPPKRRLLSGSFLLRTPLTDIFQPRFVWCPTFQPYSSSYFYSSGEVLISTATAVVMASASLDRQLPNSPLPKQWQEEY